VSQNSLSLFEAAEERRRKTYRPWSAIRTRAIVQQRHLQAARRLSRRIARLPDHSPEQLRAGRMICRHLVAMLEEAAAETESTPH
jgi:hypothetical protein